MSGKGMTPKKGYNYTKYFDNYDEIFRKEKTPSEWLKTEEFSHITIVEPNGWDDLGDYSKKLTKEDFIFKLAKSNFTETKQRVWSLWQ